MNSQSMESLLSNLQGKKLVRMNSQPIKILLWDLQRQQLFPTNSHPMGSLLINLQGKKLVPVNSQPIKNLLRDLQSQQLVPMSSQPMGSLLSNLLNNNHYRFQKHQKNSILNHTCTLDLTTGPEETVDMLNSISSDGSDIIVHSETNVITIDCPLRSRW